MLVKFYLAKRIRALPRETKVCLILTYFYQAYTKQNDANFRNFPVSDKQFSEDTRYAHSIMCCPIFKIY